MPVDFSQFDQRRYPTVDVSRGYAAWAATYNTTVPDALDLSLLEEVDGIDWASLGSVLDLGCGTGRIGSWMRLKGVRHLVGVDLVDEMLEQAAASGIYDQTLNEDIRDTGLNSASFDLVTTVLVDEHLPELQPLYTEVGHVLKEGGVFVLIGYHPHFMMQFGMPTHFDGPDGKPVAIETHIHLFEDHASAAHRAGFELTQLRERTIDEEFLATKPKWDRYKGHPVSFMFQWRKRRSA